jgi:hypothetical protein
MASYQTITKTYAHTQAHTHLQDKAIGEMSAAQCQWREKLEQRVGAHALIAYVERSDVTWVFAGSFCANCRS